MTRPPVLLCCTPVVGHVTPLLGVAAALVQAGHPVRFLTGRRFGDAVERRGAEFVPIDERFDHDDRRLDELFPERTRLTGPAQMRFDVRTLFLPPVAGQLAAIRREVEGGAAVVLTEPLFLGAAAYGLQVDRVPVIGLGITPLVLDSRDTAPFGLGVPPMPGPLGRARNAALRLLVHRVVFGRLERDVRAAFGAALGRPVDGALFDVAAVVDVFAQLGVPAFEYPRSDLPAAVRFVGPIAGEAVHAEHPDWWDDLDGRPVVHVTQGTVANGDPEELLLPTVRALADRDVLVVAATGERDPGTVLRKLGATPTNLRVASFLPYSDLLPRTSVMVTNGGYGGVQAALRHGVPLVGAGRTEDKIEVNARIAWSGAGIDLRRQRPTPRAIAAAVDRVLGERRFRYAARRIGAQLAASDAAGELVALVAEVSRAGTAR